MSESSLESEQNLTPQQAYYNLICKVLRDLPNPYSSLKDAKKKGKGEDVITTTKGKRGIIMHLKNHKDGETSVWKFPKK